MRQVCAICGSPMRDKLIDGETYWECTKKVCLFNFRDERCEKCQEPPITAKVIQPGQYLLTCAKGHQWPVQ